MESYEQSVPCFTIGPPIIDISESKEGETFDELLTKEFVCEVCSKTFFNATALHNHKNMQHDANLGNPTYTLSVKSLVGLSGFNFIPLKNDISYNQNQQDGVITRTFDQDTSYLIIKFEGENIDTKVPKPFKLQNVIKRNPPKEDKPSIDLRCKGPFTCTFPSTLCPDLQCRQIFFNCCEYSLHYRENHTKRRKAALRCQICEQRLDRDIYPTNPLSTHFQSTTSFVSFSCRICGQTFLDSARYDEHNRVIHAKMKPYQCSICTKRFTQQGGLQQHIRMHTGIRPYTCTYCPKAFTQKAGLEQHLRTHTKVKPFSCVICNKSFSQSVHLRQHMRTHTNIQPFECTVCGRRFKQSSHLNFHMRSHEDDRGDFMGMRYNHYVQQQNQLDFLKLAYLQPVQDGETMYYAAELAPQGLQANRHSFGYHPTMNADNIPTFTLD